MNKTLVGIFAAWTAAWIVAIASGRWELLVIAGFAFPQNVAFTFVSRGRNSGSLTYHLVASIFSNGIWLITQIFSIAVIAGEFSRGADPVILTLYGIVYTLSTMPGSIFAHWLAQKLERGKARNIQEDRIEILEKQVDQLRLAMIGEAELADTVARLASPEARGVSFAGLRKGT